MIRSVQQAAGPPPWSGAQGPGLLIRTCSVWPAAPQQSSDPGTVLGTSELTQKVCAGSPPLWPPVTPAAPWEGLLTQWQVPILAFPHQPSHVPQTIDLFRTLQGSQIQAGKLDGAWSWSAQASSAGLSRAGLWPS